jgi:L-fucose mutarotase
VLIGIDPLLGPDLLHALASMGHGDELAIVDANFPAASMGQRVVEVRGANSPAALRAVLSVFPVDTFVVPAVVTMEVVGDPRAVPPPVAEFAGAMSDRGLGERELGRLDRNAFYARARGAFVIVRTGELRAYGNVLLVKGVVISEQTGES